jgi:hypothetical protein
MKKILFSLLITALLTFNLHSATLTGADTGAEFLKFGIGGRASAMGEAYAAVEGDITSAYWNPAGLAGIKKKQLGAMHSAVTEDATLGFLSAGSPLAGGFMAAGGYLMHFKEEPITGEMGEDLGDLFMQHRAFFLSYGRNITGNLDGGLGVKFIQEIYDAGTILKYEGRAWAFDGGLLYRCPGVYGLNFGASIANAGQQLKIENQPRGDDLPRTIRIGAAYKYSELLSTLALNKVLDDKWRPGLGIEYKAAPGLFLRTGYYSQAGNIGGVTFGLGIKTDNFTIDWASMAGGEMLHTARENRLSFILEF